MAALNNRLQLGGSFVNASLAGAQQQQFNITAGQIEAESLNTTGSVTVGGNISAGSLDISGVANVDGAFTVVESIACDGPITNVECTTASTSTTTGSLITGGGAGIAGDVNIGGTIDAGGAITTTDTTDSTSTSTGALVTAGGLGVAKQSHFGDNISLSTAHAAGDTLTEIETTNSNTADSVTLLQLTSAQASAPSSGNFIVCTNASGDQFSVSSEGIVECNQLTLNNYLSANTISVSSTTDATNQLNAPLSTAGGLAVDKSTFIGGNLTLAATSSNLIVAGTTESTTTGTGSITTAGGLGVAKNVNVGGNLALTSASSGLTVGSTAATSSTTTGSIVTAGGMGLGAGIWAGGAIRTASTTPASSPYTGALIVAGGAGIGGATFVEGAMTSNGKIETNATTQSSSTSTGALICDGGFGCAKKAYFGEAVTVLGDTVNTGVDTGQLVLTGTNANKRLYLGYDQTNSTGVISAVNSGTSWSTLMLQSQGGDVELFTKATGLQDPSFRAGPALAGVTGAARVQIQEKGTAFVKWYSGSTDVATVYYSGGVVVYGTGSDRRLKDDIADVEKERYERLYSLKTKTFKYKHDDTKQTWTGFIADEAQEVFPELVRGEKDAVDPDGKEIHQQIDLTHLIPDMVACIQDLKRQLDELKVTQPAKRRRTTKKTEPSN